ncbi:hypothetical protein B0H14DRAFT_2583150 [Mycena olivaceomarginata]|nr:hypothetical protein B0H14DRAFT_2583150 [Mycena olivaceomarginata]
MKMRCAYENEEGVEIAVEGGGKITVRALRLVHIELPYRCRANAEMTERSFAASSTCILTLPDMSTQTRATYMREPVLILEYLLHRRTEGEGSDGAGSEERGRGSGGREGAAKGDIVAGKGASDIGVKGRGVGGNMIRRRGKGDGPWMCGNGNESGRG